MKYYILFVKYASNAPNTIEISDDYNNIHNTFMEKSLKYLSTFQSYITDFEMHNNTFYVKTPDTLIQLLIEEIYFPID